MYKLLLCVIITVLLTNCDDEGFVKTEDDFVLAANSIIRFSINGNEGVIGTESIENEKKNIITITGLPYRTDIEHLTPEVEHNGKTYEPAGSQDFSKEQTYIVTARNGERKRYKVIVEVEELPRVTALKFNIPGEDIKIDHEKNRITVTLPWDTPFSQIIAEVETTDSNKYELIRNGNDKPVALDIYTKDGSKQTYSIDVIVEPAKSPSITSFTFEYPGENVTITNNDFILVTLPVGTNITSLTPVINHTGKQYKPEGPQNFSNPVYYVVTGIDDSQEIYTVKVTANPSSEKNITDFRLFGTSGIIDDANNRIDVYLGNIPINTPATPEYIRFTGAQVTPSPETPMNFLYVVPYTITAQDGSTRTYEVRVHTDEVVWLTYLYVSQYNSSDNFDGSRARPFKSVQKAVNMAVDMLNSPNPRPVVIRIGGYIRSGPTTGTSALVDIRGGNWGSLSMPQQFHPLTLEGYNQGFNFDHYTEHIIDAGNHLTVSTNKRVIYIENVSDLVIKNVSFTGGAADRGGGIFVTGTNSTVTIENSIIRDNESAAEGGGIYIDTGSKVIFTGIISNNTADTGGGVFLKGELFVKRGIVRGNEATTWGGGIYINGGKFYLDTGIIYGGADYTDKDNGRGDPIPPPLQNHSDKNPSYDALYKDAGSAKYGVLNGSTVISAGIDITPGFTIKALDGISWPSSAADNNYHL